MADPGLIIRQARRADKKALIGLCRRSVRNDYVPMFVDEFLKDGGLFVAMDGERAVGMVKYTRCLGGDGWLGAGRTDPKHRRQGIATALMRACLKYAARQNAHYVRLWSNRGNKAAQAAIRSAGFHEVASFARVTRRARKSKARIELKVVRRSEAVMPLVRDSEILKESGGYAPFVNEFVKVDDKVVLDAVRKRKLYRHGGDLCLLETEPWFGKWRVLEFSLIAGDVHRIVEGVNGLARDVPLKSIHTYVPAGSQAARAVRSAGFKVVKWGRDAILFEKRVPK